MDGPIVVNDKNPTVLIRGLVVMEQFLHAWIALQSGILLW